MILLAPILFILEIAEILALGMLELAGFLITQFVAIIVLAIGIVIHLF